MSPVHPLGDKSWQIPLHEQQEYFRLRLRGFHSLCIFRTRGELINLHQTVGGTENKRLDNLNFKADCFSWPCYKLVTPNPRKIMKSSAVEL